MIEKLSPRLNFSKTFFDFFFLVFYSTLCGSLKSWLMVRCCSSKEVKIKNEREKKRRQGETTDNSRRNKTEKTHTLLSKEKKKFNFLSGPPVGQNPGRICPSRDHRCSFSHCDTQTTDTTPVQTNVRCKFVQAHCVCVSRARLY